MATQRASDNPEHVLRVTTRVAAVLAIVAIIFGVAARHPELGFAASAGLVIGAANLLAADKLFNATKVPFFATSGLRIVVLTAGALAVYLLFHGHVAIAFVAGAALAQLALSVSAVMATLR